MNATPSENVADDNQIDQNSSSSSVAASSSPGGARKDIYAETSVSQHDQHAIKDADPNAVAATTDEISYQKLRGSKETMFSKLKNRIRTLEDNLNLTNRWTTFSESSLSAFVLPSIVNPLIPSVAIWVQL